VRPLSLDVTDQATIDAAAAAAADVDLLINNAGVLAFGSALEGDLELFGRDVHTNYLGTVRVTRAFVPILAANRPAAIVNVLTLIALAPVGPMAGYSASKAAAHSFTQALRAEVRGRGIEVIGAYRRGRGRQGRPRGGGPPDRRRRRLGRDGGVARRRIERRGKGLSRRPAAARADARRLT
jgi:NAD(P)-dependent dehydrogenase (short-subunit alcohol dehydrogenase family)